MSQLKSIVSEKIAALSLAAHRDEEGARFVLELIVKPFGIKPGKNLAWNNVSKKFAAKVKDMTDADIGLALAQAPHDLVAEHLGIEITKEAVHANEEPLEDSIELPAEVAAVDEPRPALEHAIANAHATIETIEEAIQAEPDPVKREETRTDEPKPETRRTVVIDDKEFVVIEGENGPELHRDSKCWVKFPQLKGKDVTDMNLLLCYRSYQESLAKEHGTKQAKADVLTYRNAIKGVSDAVLHHLSKNVKFGDEVREARLFVAKTRDSAFSHIDIAGRGLYSKNSKELLPLNKVQAELHTAELLGGQLQAMAFLWEVKCEEKFEKASVAGLPGPKVINKPATVPATQPTENVGKEDKMSKANECEAALAALKGEFNGLSEAARKRVQKDFLKNVATIVGHVAGGRLDKALGAIEGQRENLRKAVAATTPKTPVVVESTNEPASEPAKKEEPVSVTETEAPEAAAVVESNNPTSASEPATQPTENVGTTKEEDTMSKPHVETKSQRQERIKVRNAATIPAAEPAQQAGQTPVETPKEKPVSTPTTKQKSPVTTNAPADPKAETPKVEEKKDTEPKLKSTILGTIRCWLHNADEGMRVKFGPLPGAEEFGKLAEAIKLACEGEEKALISPKGKGDVRDTLIKGMNVLVEAAAVAKVRTFTCPVNGKVVHVPTRILELEGLIKTLKNGEKQAAERELTLLYAKRDEASAKWSAEAAQASMSSALKALTPEEAAKLAIHIQALGNYGIVRNLPEGEGRFVVKGFKPEVSLERVKELATPYVAAEGLKITDEVIKSIKARVESIKTDAAYQKLLADVALVRSQIARLLKAEPGEEKKVEAMQQRSLQLAIVGGIIDEMRVGSTAPTLSGWGMTKENAPVWTRDHDLLVNLILNAKDGEHSLPGCGEDKKETVGHLAASMLVTFAYSAQTPDGNDLTCHEWQVALDRIKNAKQLEEQVAKPGFRGYSRQLVWGLYVGCRWTILRIAGLISWAGSPIKAAWYGLKALALYGASVVSTKKGEEYKTSAKAAIERSGQCLKEIVTIPWNGIKGAWNYFFGDKKVVENTGTSAPINPADKKENEDMKSTFLRNTGLEGITDYPFGKEAKDLKGEEKSSLGAKWEDQTTGQKAATVATLPFRAVKRVVVAQPAISAGVVTGGVTGGVVGSVVLGATGVATVGTVLGGALLGGLLVWGAKKLFGSKKAETPKVIDPATGTTVVSTPAPEAPVAAPAQQAAA
jgi:hypothetical protein